MVEKTYADASYERTWDALFVMGDLFRATATAVAERLGFDYPCDDERKVSAHLRHVRQLPREAAQMY